MQRLLQHLFGKTELADLTLAEVEQVTTKYPYFAAGHFLLAKKLKHAGNVEYETQVQKTSLYFNNPLWLSFQLQQKELRPSASTVLETEKKELSSFNLNDFLLTNEEEKKFMEETVETDLSEVHEDEAVFAKIAETLSQQAEEAAKPVEIKPEVPAFEPYHTIDYFASQGIKTPQEVKAGDKFGTQLKSFTEWLKGMRRLPQATLESELAKSVDDEKVKASAATSNETAEVLTETMAEVYVKQGKIENAIEVYNKLSLLNPSKSAYFASKIEGLK